VKICSMNLLRNIVAGVWMVDKATVLAAAPFVAKLAKGEPVVWDFGANQNQDRRPYAYWERNNARYYDWSSAPAESVAVHTLIGAVTKYGGMCGGGTEEMMASMERADRQENIIAHLLEIDSGGGEATNIETTANFVRASLKKPVVAIVNGVAASAAYWIAAAADEIYASEPTDEFGSIGVVLSFADARPMWEEMGVKFHEIYASESSLKNEDFNKALAGDYEDVRNKILDPYANSFINGVKKLRLGMKDDDQVFKGQTYMANDAKKIGLIDGLKTWEQALERAVQLGKRAKSLGSRDAAINRNSANNKSINIMANDNPIARINAVLGYDLNVDADGGVYLQRAELQQIERSLNASQPEAVLEATVDSASLEAFAGISAQLTQMSTTLQSIQTEQNAQAARLDTLEDRTPGSAGPTVAKAAGDPPAGDGGDASDADALKALATADAAAAKNWSNPYTRV
jgi:signal peptide peptidase SppA